MIRIVLGNLRGGRPADHIRVFGTACVAAVGTVLLLCVMAYASAADTHGMVRPLFAGLLVLAVTAQLTAVGSRLTASARAARTELLVGPNSEPEQVRQLAATEAGLAGSLGAVAGLQAHLIARAVFERGVPGGGVIRDMLAVGGEIPVLGLAFVLGVVPIATMVASTLALPEATRAPAVPRPARTVTLGAAGPVLLAAGLTSELLPDVLAGPVRLPGDLGSVHPFAAGGYVLVVAGTALSVPWLVRQVSGAVAVRTRQPALLCAARRVEADTTALTAPLGLLAMTTTLLVTSRTLRTTVPGAAAGDLPLLAVVTAATVCGAAGLLAVLVETARERKDAARAMHTLGADASVDRLTRVLGVLLPLAVAWGGAAVAGVVATWPLEFGGDRPALPVSARAVSAGVTFAVTLAAAVALAMVPVSRRLARDGVHGWGRPTPAVPPPSG
ncbi:hypothetical protein [Yinghuangia seranimata]|uniref:hypothetical protein n=1 Tax=Yinghuangia seranimata TaxID=408067 RepID=UPI00248AED83|nr:hypothetical protein [Yinghuangia seranimata]MDI2127505.1 hypothetical protein [Yinghuangia seranimata]